MHVAYDLESYPNCFTMAVMPTASAGWWVYEISERRNDAPFLRRDMLSGMYTRMYGFRSMAFDYPLLHHFMTLNAASGLEIAKAMYQKTEQLIATPWGKDYLNYIWPDKQYVQQCCLYLLNHFDNKAKITSLKDLMFNLECPDMAELPFAPGTWLTPAEIDVLIHYNVWSDTWTTHKFSLACIEAIAFREKLMAKGIFGAECLNFNDVKIGEKFFINRLEAARPGVTKKDANGRKPQTWRASINVGDVILPEVKFERPELRELLANLKETVVNGMELKGSYNFKVPLDDVVISIGAGGIHGALDRRIIRSTSERVVIDIDVEGYYPSVAIENRFYPEHIGPVFSDVYRSIRDDRNVAKRAGDIAQAGALKLSNNGAFGKTNDHHSVLLDAKCMLAITVNGQLLQCQLAEALLRIPGCRLLQLNTDGLTVDIPRQSRELFNGICAWWQRTTRLRLEFADFDALWLRDCNSYLARSSTGKMKRKGAYDHEMLSGSIGGQKAWNKDFSALVIPKAAEAAFVADHDPVDFIEHHACAYDFLLRARMKDGSKLQYGHDGPVLGKLARYYIAEHGSPLVKIMKPLPGKTTDRRIGIHAEGRAEALGTRKDYRCSMCGQQFMTKGLFEEHNKTAHAWPVQLAMKWEGSLPVDLDRRWYVAEVEKLLF